MKIELSGNLTGAEVYRWYRRIKASFKRSTGLAELDLSGVRQVDCTAVALLVELVKLARQQRLDLKLTHLPKTLSRWIALVKLSEQLPLA